MSANGTETYDTDRLGRGQEGSIPGRVPNY
jgi:hypothetical protein